MVMRFWRTAARDELLMAQLVTRYHRSQAHQQPPHQQPPHQQPPHQQPPHQQPPHQQPPLPKIFPHLTAGVDEAGRGSAIGRLYVAAVIIGEGRQLDLTLVDDSKKLSKKRRNKAYDHICDTVLDYEIGWASQTEIDEKNVTQATLCAWHRCLDALAARQGPLQHVIVDGKVWRAYDNVSATVEPKADANYGCVAAASILAKVSRDRYIQQLVNDHPELGLAEYDIHNNMGYLSARHRAALKYKGRTPFHRSSYTFKFLSGE